MFAESTVAFLVSVIEAVAGLKMMARKQTMSSQDDQMFSWPVILSGQVHGFKIHTIIGKKYIHIISVNHKNS